MATKTDIDLKDTAAVCDILDRAAEANHETAGRSGCVIDMGEKGSVLMTGDLHDHPANFRGIRVLAELGACENHHVVLQETIHGENLVNGIDTSYRMLAQIAQWKIEFPGQVHHIFSNHEMSQLTGEGILKDGVSAVEAFDKGIDFVFGEGAEAVRESVKGYLRSLPLAVRCANGVMCAHSLPSPCHKDGFDADILKRELKEADLKGPEGHAYVMVWGRGLAQTVADELGEHWGVKVYVLGHQHAEYGWEHAGQSMVIINSDHRHGVAIPVDLSREYTRDELCEEVLQLNGVG